MAQLKDLIVNGVSRFIGDAIANSLQVTTVKAPAASGSSSYGAGASNQVLKSNGTSVYWGTDDNTTYTAATATPLVNGTAAVGTSDKYAREDHVHPTDTTRAPTAHASTATTYGIGTSGNYGHVKLSDSVSATNSAASGIAATPSAVKAAYDLANGRPALNTSTTPVMDGTAAIGSATTAAKADHVHPIDTSRAPTAHASTATTYGAGTSANYGHLKLSDAINSTSSTSGGIAATPSAVKKAYDLAYETNQLVTPFVNSKIKRWNPTTNGKIIFIGNSYSRLDNRSDGGRPASDSSYNYWKWPEIAAKSLGLEDHIGENFEFYTESADWTWWNIGKPYHSLANAATGSSFIEDLAGWVTNHPTQLENVGAIVLVAGINDSRGDIVEGETSPRCDQVPTKLEELASYIKDPDTGYPNGRFPNAVLYNGYTGWINESVVGSPADARSYDYRQIVANYYMEARYCGWNYLNGIENVFHDKKMFKDYVHPNEEGQKRLGIAVANALITGTCDVAYRNVIQGNQPATGDDPFTAGVVGYSDNANYTVTQTNTTAFIEESIQGNTNRIHYDSFEIEISPARTFNVNSSYTIITAPIRFANACDMGNQIFEIKDNNNASYFMVARPFIQRATGLIRLQIKGFSDGSSSKKVSKIEKFICDTTNHLLND